MKFTDMQNKAANHVYGPALVLAVPGSGKTTVLLERIKRLKKDFNPKKILTLTFSKKQSIDMKNRYGKSDTNFMTIHAFCYLIIRNYLKKYNRNLRLIESDDSYNKYHLLRDIYIDINKKRPSREDIQEFFTKVSYMNNALLDKDFLKDIRIKNIVKLYDAYESFKKDKNLIDFDDMQVLALRMITNDGKLLRSIHNKYEFFQLDEGQDTSLIQFKILEKMVSKNNNLMVVADDDQSIYSFRAAEPSYLLNFKDNFPQAKIIVMNENHRSCANIINLADNFIRDNKYRYKKSMKASKAKGAKVKFKLIRDSKAQYEFIKKNISSNHTNAVLFRNNITALNLVSYLMEDKISFSISTDFLDFFKSQIVKDFFDIIRFSEDFNDIDTFENIYYKIASYLKKSEIESLYLKDKNSDVFDHFYQKLDYDKKNNLYEIEKKLKHIRKLKLDKKITYIYKYLGYKKYISFRSNKYGEEILNKDLFVESLANFTRGLENIKEFEEKLKYLKQYLRINKAENLSLETIHKSKGLEYDKVFVIDLIENEFPIIDYERDYEISIEEERRIFYVAITRAKNELFLLSIKRRNGKKTQASEFFTKARQIVSKNK